MAHKKLTKEDAWAMLGNTPIDDEEKIEEPFLHFEIGTDRLEIWQWFEEHYNFCLGDFIYKS